MNLMASLENYHETIKANKAEELKKLTVICHLCNGDVGIIDTERIELPLKGHMFASYDPEHGVEAFFAPDADWENMWCKWGIANPVDGHHPFPPTKVLTKERGWYEPKGSVPFLACPICKIDGVDSILEADPDKPGYTICPIHGEREFDLGEPVILPMNNDTTLFNINQCKICGKEYKSKQALGGHVKIHRKKGKEKTDGSKRRGRKTANRSNSEGQTDFASSTGECGSEEESNKKDS